MTPGSTPTGTLQICGPKRRPSWRPTAGRRRSRLRLKRHIRDRHIPEVHIFERQLDRVALLQSEGEDRRLVLAPGVAQLRICWCPVSRRGRIRSRSTFSSSSCPTVFPISLRNLAAPIAFISAAANVASPDRFSSSTRAFFRVDLAVLGGLGHLDDRGVDVGIVAALAVQRLVEGTRPPGRPEADPHSVPRGSSRCDASDRDGWSRDPARRLAQG